MHTSQQVYRPAYIDLGIRFHIKSNNGRYGIDIVVYVYIMRAVEHIFGYICLELYPRGCIGDAGRDDSDGNNGHSDHVIKIADFLFICFQNLFLIFVRDGQ
jgi:hypothetical protein